MTNKNNDTDRLSHSSPLGRLGGVTIHLNKTDSTNNYLKNLLLHEEVEDGTAVITDYQTAGRGQRGNYWESEKGKNILFSMVLYPTTIKANEQSIISQFVALAVKDYLDQHLENIAIKWSNDIYWNDKKICGILIENSLTGDQITQSIIGIGLNVNQTVFKSDAPNPVSLKQITGSDYDTEAIVKEIRDKVCSYHEKIKERQNGNIIKAYKDALYRRTGYHIYNDGEKDFKARIIDVEPNGLLVLETAEGEIRKFAFKEVKYII